MTPSDQILVMMRQIDGSAVAVRTNPQAIGGATGGGPQNEGAILGSGTPADLAVLRLNTPWYPVEMNNPFAREFHHGDLDFKGDAKAEILALLQAVPTIVVLYLDRPAVIPEINAAAKELVGEYGASDETVLDVIFGKANPQGRLPFELQSSMDAVRNQKPDVPYDSEHPLYPFGFGLSY